MTDLRGHGLRLTLPSGCEGRIAALPPAVGPGEVVAADAATTALVQVATVPIPPDAGDLGGGVVQALTSRDLFFSLGEFGAESVGTALFAPQGIPQLRPADASPSTLRLMLPGQSAIQRFFTVNGRPFSLYVVFGSHTRRIGLVGVTNDILGSLQID